MKNTTVLVEKGTGKTEDARTMVIPDLWYLAMWLKGKLMFRESDEVLEAWHLAHAMRDHIITEE
jgi:hypothetical protein